MRPASGSFLSDVNGGGRAPWTERLYAWRDRMLASQAFQRFAARFPLTRPIARNKAKTLFGLCTGFVYSQVLLACVRLDLFRQLRAGPLTLDEITERLDLPRDAAERLLLAACSLDLAAKRGEERFGLGELGAAFLGNPGLDAMVEHHANFYQDLRDPVALLRGEVERTELQRYWPYAGADDKAGIDAGAIADYSHLMAATQPMIATHILDAYPIERHRRLMDVGGGEGAFLEAVADRVPNLDLRLFDLPAVAQRAKRRLEAKQMAGRLTVTGGDFYRDPLPKGADLISLVRIIHDHDDDAALNILKSVREALPPGGTLLLAEPMAGTPGAEAMGDAYFGFYFLAMGRGRARRVGELLAMLREAGFASSEPLPTRIPLLVSVIKATVN
jgi:demethylspheroidene O-methyltransferase